MKDMKRRFVNLTIHKRLSYSFSYLCVVIGLLTIVSLFQITSLKRMLNNFYNNAYRIEESALNARIALSNIQNNLYKANTAKKIEASNKFVQNSESDYKNMITNIDDIMGRVDAKRMITDEIYKALQTELKKAERYRKQIIIDMDNSDITSVYETFTNDYQPILNTISNYLDRLRETYKKNAYVQITNANHQMTRNMILFIFLVILSYLSSFYLVKITTKSIVEPINEIERAMVDISKGKLDVVIQYQSNEELGILCDSIRHTIYILKSYITNITYVLKELENKNMDITIQVDYVGDFSPIKKSLTNIIYTFNGIIYSMKDTASYITEGAHKVKENAKEIEVGAYNQAHSIHDLVNKVNIVSDNVSKTALYATKVNEVSKESLNIVNKGNEYMDSLLLSMKTLTSQSNEISKIIHVIKKIADETNLLSLNASIEAARDAMIGKGFAVIAKEISKLAEQCTASTKTTEKLIHESIDAINFSFQLTDDTAEILQNVVRSSTESGDFVDSICHANKKQANELSEVLLIIQEISAVVESNSNSAKLSHIVSEDFLLSTHKLNVILDEFILKDDVDHT